MNGILLKDLQDVKTVREFVSLLHKENIMVKRWIYWVRFFVYSTFTVLFILNEFYNNNTPIRSFINGFMAFFAFENAVSALIHLIKKK